MAKEEQVKSVIILVGAFIINSGVDDKERFI
jgi:hypothetical protein